MEDLTVRNQYLEERLLSLESQLSREPLSRPSVSAAQFSYNCFSQHLNTLSLISLMPACKRHSSSQTLSFSTPLIMKNKRLASPSHLSCSSNVVDLISFDTSEAEPPQSQIHLDQSTDMMGQSVHVEESGVGESEDPVHADKSEAQEERSEDSEKADKTRGQDESGQDETLEVPKTDGEDESGATHEMTEKVLDEGEVDKAERSKEQLGEGESKEHVEMNEGEPSQDVKPSTQSEELKDSGRILDTTLTSREPETEVVSQPDPSEDLEACTNTDLNFAEDDLDVTDDLLEPLESEFTIPLDKKHAMKSKKVHDESSVGCPVKPPL